MSSGFVSGGTVDNEIERDDAWRAAQKEIEEKRRLKAEEEEKHGAGGQSLFEVLRANEAAKEEAFQAKTRLANQYRGLNDDEAEYLESLMDKKRQEEAAVRKDTLEQLEVFRKQQEEAERKALEEENKGPPATEDSQWIASGRKRKKGHEGGLLKGVKLKKAASSPEEKQEVKASSRPDSKDKTVGGQAPAELATKGSDSATKTATPSATKPPVPPAKPLSLSLGYASSDEDD